MRGILGEIPGGARHIGREPPPAPQPYQAFTPGLLVAGGGEGGGREGQEDLLSAVPGDVLPLVLLHLPSAAAAARISVLSWRWRRLWAHLPGLRFPHSADLARSRAAPAAHSPPPAARA
ncbi:hypothetical protein GQ55_2G056300 [Panicum hallii var. hallii]|uniref:F-box domain-containing protein n=1 Tax=Panicum hallii var. hallii TaxID=1504633 RepID=A0A2T7ELR4_9POAL|nr:hypothetical protein GQ55_2G056300 [Panicum hallii var. hallii]